VTCLGCDAIFKDYLIADYIVKRILK